MRDPKFWYNYYFIVTMDVTNLRNLMCVPKKSGACFRCRCKKIDILVINMQQVYQLNTLKTHQKVDLQVKSFFPNQFYLMLLYFSVLIFLVRFLLMKQSLVLPKLKQKLSMKQVLTLTLLELQIMSQTSELQTAQEVKSRLIPFLF